MSNHIPNANTEEVALRYIPIGTLVQQRHLLKRMMFRVHGGWHFNVCEIHCDLLNLIQFSSV